MSRLTRMLQTYHPIVLSLLLGTVMARAAASMSLPFLALYLAKHTSLSPAMIGITIGIGSLAGTFGGFIGGTLSDKFGRRIVMMSALYVWGFVFIGFALADHFWMFLLLNMINGLCRSFYEPVSQALMSDLTEPERRFRVFSLRYTAINIGVSVGPLLGAAVGLVDGSIPFLVTGSVYLLYALTLHRLLTRFGIRRIEGQKKEGASFGSALRIVSRDSVLRLFLIGGIVTAIGYAQMTVTLSQYLEQSFVNGVALFAVLMSVNAVTVIILQLPFSRWSEKRSPLAGISVGITLYALGDAGFALASGWWTMIAAMVVFTLGEILTFPAGSMLIDRIAPEGMRGAYFGAQTFSSLGHFIGPWLGGLLLLHFGGANMFLTMAGISLTAIWFYGRGYRKHLAAASPLSSGQKPGM